MRAISGRRVGAANRNLDNCARTCENVRLTPENEMDTTGRATPRRAARAVWIVVGWMLAALVAAALARRLIPGTALAYVFAAAAAIAAALAQLGRRARLDAEGTARLVIEQSRELTEQQAQAESLASELEQATVELETALEDAKDARDAAMAGEERLRLLDEVGRVLSSSLDYQTTVTAVARLAVPKFADWCAVDLLVDGAIEQLALAHVDPAKVAWARELGAKYPPRIDAPTGVPAVIRSGEPQLIGDVTDEMLVASAVDEEHLEILRELGVYSAVIVPIQARGLTLGAMTLISSTPTRHFDQSDLSLMMQLARRSAMAMDNARLHRAAVRANEAKANFLATMSHELRTPLTAIIGYEELLAEGIPGSVNEIQRQQLARIKASASHLLSLVDEILLYARVEAGRESARIEHVVARGVIDDAIAFVAPTAAERSLTVRAVNVDPALMLRTDPGKLRQMLLNLLANAVKFTVKGSITVGGFAEGDSVVFEVRDTGIGLTRESMRRIFDPFWQVDQHTTRVAGGSGLGLSVTQRLAKLLGGDVSVESEPLVGSTFRIRLPKSPR
jgi:signal transduction histidine kinase